MRLIDADELIKQACRSTEWSHGEHPMVIEADDIDDVPTVDAEPVKHAHWEIEKTVCARFARCSSCGIHIRIPTTGHKENERFYLYPDEMHYCPNCGAKMEKEEKK